MWIRSFTIRVIIFIFLEPAYSCISIHLTFLSLSWPPTTRLRKIRQFIIITFNIFKQCFAMCEFLVRTWSYLMNPGPCWDTLHQRTLSISLFLLICEWFVVVCVCLCWDRSFFIFSLLPFAFFSSKSLSCQYSCLNTPLLSSSASFPTYELTYLEDCANSAAVKSTM